MEAEQFKPLLPLNLKYKSFRSFNDHESVGKLT